MTTKVCPKCGSKNLVHIATQFIKICNDCETVIKWDLDEGQKPLITNNRVKNDE
jgi:transcription initiation factor TFIIIB Brf1 subunit/transcription initiation factor TFIIB